MDREQQELRLSSRWQTKLLPFMVIMLSVLTLFFFAASVIQLYYLHHRIEIYPELDMDKALHITGNLRDSDIMSYTQWKTLSMLEGYALQRRYHQANVLLMSRIWTRYLGFVTGMILAMVGAAFILGKLRETESRIESESAAGKFSITSASPGLILACLGTVLMITTMIVHHDIEVKDDAVFLKTGESPYIKEAGKVHLSDNISKDLDEIEKKLKKK